MAQPKVSVFSKLQENFRHLYELLKCSECKRKIDHQSKCFSCDGLFCTECLFQTKKTKMCRSCKAIDSVKPIKNRNSFIEELLDLIHLFDTDTGIKIVKEEFLNVETAENLERIFDKEKTNVFNQQKFIATSTPNINNAKKVAFNSDITMIPQNAVNKQVESAEKVVMTKKADKATSNSKRKADSLEEKSDSSSRSKKAKLVEPAATTSSSEEDEIPKENEVNNELETAAQTPATDKHTSIEKQHVPNDKQSSIAKKNVSLQNNSQQVKQFEEQLKTLKEEKRHIEEEFKRLEETYKVKIDENVHLEDKYKQANVDNKQLNERCRELEENIRLLEAKRDFEEKSIQLFKQQMKEMNSVLNADRMREMMIVGLTRIVCNTEEPITSSIELENLGKVNFTIEPLKVIEKAKVEMRNFEVQTDEIKRSTAELYVQTEPLIVNLPNNKDIKDHLGAASQGSQSVDNAIRQVVNNVVEECDGVQVANEGNNLKPNKSANNFSIQFDDESISNKQPVAKQTNGEAEEIIDSDELKKPVANESIFDDSDEDDEVGASSPIY